MSSPNAAQKVPPGVIAVVMVAIIAAAAFALFRYHKAEDYEQADVAMKCTACGHEGSMTVKKYQDRMATEHPGAETMLGGGIALTCPKCNKQTYAMSPTETGPMDAVPATSQAAATASAPVTESAE